MAKVHIRAHFVRGSDYPYLTPMGSNYETVGDFYTALSDD